MTTIMIMAGGTGSRLEPVTTVLPKPLIPIHGIPIVNHIIDKFYALGFMDYHLSVNYKSGIIKAYFEELNHDYSVSFIEEHKPLGTAGSLSNLIGKINSPFYVTNCDIIVDVDYLELYEFHLKNNYDITLVASAREFTVPYGVCVLDDKGTLSHIHEKPKYDFLVNTGLYILNQDIKSSIKKIYTNYMKNHKLFIEVIGHTDRSGTDKYNILLSKLRANEVKKYLLSLGILEDNINTFYFGEKKPKIITKDGVREKINRRVEIFIDNSTNQLSEL